MVHTIQIKELSSVKIAKQGNHNFKISRYECNEEGLWIIDAVDCKAPGSALKCSACDPAEKNP